MKVASDDEVAWPMSWYLRDYPGFFGADVSRDALADAAVVVVGPKNWAKTERLLSGAYHRYEVIRMWWPMEAYKALTWERIRFALTDPAMRAALWDIAWRRDYTRFGEAAGQASSYDPPRSWILEDRMRVYIRADLAQAMGPDLRLAGYQLADLPPQVDIYAGVRRELSPDRALALPGLNTPRNLALAPDGSIYITDTGNHRIIQASPDGEILQTWGSPTTAGQMPAVPEPAAPGTFQEPWGLAVDAAGNVYVADTWNHRIQKFDSQGSFLLEWGTGGVRAEGEDRMWGPRAVATGAGGQVYVADTGNRRIAAFDSQGRFLYDFESEGEALLDEPVGLAVGRDGRVYVADTWNARVAVFSAQGQFLSSWPVAGWNSASLDNKPYLAVDDLNRVYLTDPEGYRVIVFDEDGQALAEFGEYGTEAFGLPNGIATGPGGEVWVADAGNQRVVVYAGVE
jgi:DNA-binding beta-propeller fold protein YncE